MATATALAATTLPAVAPADILVESLRPEGKSAASANHAVVSRTLISPGRPATPLASRTASLDERAVPGAIAPDRRWMALAAGSGIELLPTDGSASRMLRRPGNDATVDGLSTVWWSADSRRVSISQSRRFGGRSSVLRCDVETARCESRGVGDRQILGVLAGERLVTTETLPKDVVRALSLELHAWQNTTAKALDRDRRALSRVERQSIDVLEPDGRTRTLWQTRRSAATGRWSYLVSSRPQSSEVLLAAARSRTVIRTRTVRGRLQSRLEHRESGARLWRIDPEGRRLTTQPSPARDRSFLRLFAGFVRVPGVGWLERFGTGMLLDPPNGGPRSLTVDGRPLTIPRLEARLLGRPPVRSSAANGLEVAGFEPATGSAVVEYQGDRDRWVVARVPLDGTTPPTAVYRGVEYEDLWSVHAW